MRKLILLSLVLLVSQPLLYSQNQIYKDVNSGEGRGLSDWVGTKHAVVLFTKQDCPYDDGYVERVENLIKTYPGLLFIRVNSNSRLESRLESMKKYYKSNNLSGLYLSDPDQTLLKRLNARKSTEAFIIKISGNQVLTLYHGAIDSNPLRGDDVREHYLEDAIVSILAGKRVILKETAVSGCAISY